MACKPEGTHHFACDCREKELAEKIESLEAEKRETVAKLEKAKDFIRGCHTRDCILYGGLPLKCSCDVQKTLDSLAKSAESRATELERELTVKTQALTEVQEVAERFRGQIKAKEEAQAGKNYESVMVELKKQYWWDKCFHFETCPILKKAVLIALAPSGMGEKAKVCDHCGWTPGRTNCPVCGSNRVSPKEAR